MNKIFVSLPVNGEDYVDQRNHAFVVATNLAQNGYEVITQFDVEKSVTTPFNETIANHIEAMLECDGIYLCRGWSDSRVCQAVLQVALIYKKSVMTE